MKGKFPLATDLVRDHLDWGSVASISGPIVTKAQDLVVLYVSLLPGKGHNFHKHPAQEEVIYVLDGKIEQWIGEDMKQLKQGDSAFIPAGMVHASFNIDKNPATVLAILGPAVGADGYEVVDVGEEPPWINLRNPDG